MNEAHIKEAMARELSREIRIQNAKGVQASQEELRDWFAWWNTSKWIEENGGHEHATKGS